MPSMSLLLDKLRNDYPDLTFQASDRFFWAPSEHIIYYDPDSPLAEVLLHEVSHSILNHTDYTRDVELLAMERQAWDTALGLAGKYELTITDDTVQDYLDTYRDWLEARSTCPDCQATGHETKRHTYNCVACGHSWRVNEARICALRRYSAKT